MKIRFRKNRWLSVKHVLFLVFLVCVVLIAVVASNNQGLLPLSPVTVNITQDTLSGSAYLYSDTSALLKDTVSFGFPTSVSFTNSGSMTSDIKIKTGNLAQSTPINPLDFGADEIWYDGGYGVQNLKNYQLYPGVIKQTKSIGITVLRYPGGIPSDTFNWQSAIGPQSKRTSNVIYQSKDIFLPSTFGPDEFGQLLEQTGSVGDITVNFGTGTAQEAANWVQYMTASSTNNYWGKLRAKYGHVAPYNIPYWEVGNEQQSTSGENYWRSGTVVSINTTNGKCTTYDIHLCEYVFGGTTAFNKQKVLSAGNDTVGNGKPDQSYYAQYPPIADNSQKIYVNGKLWRQVSDLNNASANAQVYELNNSSGEINFGSGIHGEVVPINAEITITYESGPHDGFNQYYQLMKKADPNAKICSSYQSEDFIQLMGSTYPYDCLVTHLYGGNIPSTQTSPLLFHDSLMEQSFSFASTISDEQKAINIYAGKQAKNISIAVTEYGVNARTKPSGQPNYHRSQDMALFVANTLKIIIDNRIPIAEKHYLISYEYSQPQGTQSYINSPVFANNALLAGPGPDPVPQPSAYVLQAYTKLLYPNLIGSNVQNNPTIVFSGGSYSALSVIATTDKKGHEALMVINLSPDNNIQAEIQPSLDSYTEVNAWTLGSQNFLAYNTPNNRSAVSFTKTTANLYEGKLLATFPASSVTVLELSN